MGCDDLHNVQKHTKMFSLFKALNMIRTVKRQVYHLQYHLQCEQNASHTPLLYDVTITYLFVRVTSLPQGVTNFDNPT